VEGGGLSDGGGDFFHGHIGEPEFAEGSAGLDKVEWDLEHRVSGEFEGDDGIGVLVEDDGDRAQAASCEIDVFKVFEYEFFILDKSLVE
jgi:hypothetical protein